jgi:catechol 2,3-dioxygenase-like lactoylglutathione lyase family enzyme
LLNGLNHLTLAVADLERSFAFYKDLLGFRPAAIWDTGAYLELGALWLCLSLDSKRAERAAGAAPDYTHYAFSIAQDDFAAFRARLLAAGVPEWRQNKSEGDSFYFLDPDGHQLEAHVGNLASRLAECRVAPYAGMRFFE